MAGSVSRKAVHSPLTRQRLSGCIASFRSGMRPERSSVCDSTRLPRASLPLSGFVLSTREFRQARLPKPGDSILAHKAGEHGSKFPNRPLPTGEFA